MTATLASSVRDPGAPTGMNASFLDNCRIGLSQAQKTIPCKWLYDAEGSRLFELICQTPEYYPSRTEMALLNDAAPLIGDLLSPDTALIEFGSGASRKTRVLLDAIDSITSYVPIDINQVELARATKAIGDQYPWLELIPILGDFTSALDLGPTWMFAERIGFFPGATLGNFAHDDAIGFLRSARQMLGPGSRLLLGVDLIKDVDVLLAAYNDAAGVTAAFNLNLLARTNRELGADFDLDAFQHQAIWNADQSRIEMHLKCRRDQVVRLGDQRFTLSAGDTIHTESAHKLDRAEIERMIVASAWRIERQWISDAPTYALMLLQC